MAYARWIFKGSLVDEYGIALSPVMQAAYGSGYGQDLYGITLFANGHVMQMLEGDNAALQTAERNLREMSKLFGMEPLLHEPIEAPAARNISVGLSRYVDLLSEHLPPNVQVFNLCEEEICQRTTPGAARDLLLGFIWPPGAPAH